MLNKIYYLGPNGSYSDLAKNKFLSYFNDDAEFIPVDSIYKIMRTLKEDSSSDIAAVIPIENSIEGIVRDTQDNLFALVEKGFSIIAETNLTIEHSLIGFGAKDQIKTITSHPQALAQCREYLFRYFGDDVNLLPALSTSAAVTSVTAEDVSLAAIGSSFSAEIYNRPVIDTKINDEKNNTTRFLLVAKDTPKNIGKNKVSITFSTENKPGALNKVLLVLEKYELNMSYIDSRPSRKELGEYVFYIDFEGHIEDSKVSLALLEIQTCVKMLEILSKGAVCVQM